MKSHAPRFRNAKYLAQWEATLGGDYCRRIRNKPVHEINAEALLSVLQPMWAKVPETASRLRGRIENVSDAARAMGYRDGANPATGRGHLRTLLPARQKLTRGHHAALALSGTLRTHVLSTASGRACSARSGILHFDRLSIG